MMVSLHDRYFIFTVNLFLSKINEILTKFYNKSSCRQPFFTITNVFYLNLLHIAFIPPRERPKTRRVSEFGSGEKTSWARPFLMSQKIFLTVCKINFLRERSLCAYQERRFLTSILLHLDLSLDDAFSYFLQYSESDCAWASGSKNKQAEGKNHNKPSV